MKFITRKAEIIMTKEELSTILEFFAFLLDDDLEPIEDITDTWTNLNKAEDFGKCNCLNYDIVIEEKK
jgi:hypothetical protein